MKISVAPREAAVPADVVRDDPNDRTPAPPKKIRRRFIDGDGILALAKKPFNGQFTIFQVWGTLYTNKSFITGRNIKNIVRTAQALALSQ